MEYKFFVFFIIVTHGSYAMLSRKFANEKKERELGPKSTNSLKWSQEESDAFRSDPKNEWIYGPFKKNDAKVEAKLSRKFADEKKERELGLKSSNSLEWSQKESDAFRSDPKNEWIYGPFKKKDAKVEAKLSRKFADEKKERELGEKSSNSQITKEICEGHNFDEDTCRAHTCCKWVHKKCSANYEAICEAPYYHYSEQDYGKEIRGDVIINYLNHAEQKTNGYIWMHTNYVGEFKIPACKLFANREMYELKPPTIDNSNEDSLSFGILDFTQQGKALKDMSWENKSYIQNYVGYKFVLSPAKRLYLSEYRSCYHSYFLNGGPVLAAGDISFERFPPKCVITNISGHYQPCFICLENVIKFFQDHGIQDPKCTLREISF